MTKAEINKILNKTTWKGAELGKLEIKIMADLYQQNKKGIKNPTPLIPLAQLRRMIQSIEDKKEGEIFNGYNALYSWVNMIKSCAEAMQQQAVLRYQMLEKYFRTSILSEDVYRYASSLPVIMTQAQYNKAKKENIRTLIKDKEESIVFEFLRATNYYTSQLERNPKGNNPLKKIKDQYSKENVKSQYIKQKYNKVTGFGYYQLKDGRRSDQMSPEEWQKAVHPYLFAEGEYIKEHNGKRSPEGEYSYFSRWRKRNSFLFYGLSEQEADHFIEQEDIKAGRSLETEWHYYPEPPKDLTKWDMIEDIKALWGCYFDAFSEQTKQEDCLAELQDFLEEFRELANILIEDINEKILPFVETKDHQQPITSLQDIPIEQWRDYKIKLEALYKNNIYSTKEEYEKPRFFLKNNPRALFNGVAIIDKDDYTEPVIDSSFKEKTLEGFFTNSPDYAYNVDVVRTSRILLAESYYYVKGFNTLLEIIADYYHTSDVTAFKCTMENKLRIMIKDYNNLIPTLYGAIRENYYLDTELQRKKIQALKDNFIPLDLEKLEIKEEIIEQVKASLKDFNAFRGETVKNSGSTDWLSNLACRLPIECYEEL